MDKEIKKKWMAALRSDKYQQIRKRLRKGKTGMCCLGVLCDIVEPKLWFHNKHRGFTYEGQKSFPPKGLVRNVGLYSQTIDKLVEMNDSQNKSFKEIAAYISKRL
jgi:hypothetical protein